MTTILIFIPPHWEEERERERVESFNGVQYPLLCIDTAQKTLVAKFSYSVSNSKQ